jgi:hypothetical protein
MSYIKIICEEIQTSSKNDKLYLVIFNPELNNLLELFKASKLSDSEKQAIIAEFGIENIKKYFDLEVKNA